MKNSLARKVIRSVRSRLKVLVPGECRLTSEIIDPGLWSTLSSGERKIAGRILAHTVQRRLLPLTFAGKSGQHHQYYSIAPEQTKHLNRPDQPSDS